MPMCTGCKTIQLNNAERTTLLLRSCLLAAMLCALEGGCTIRCAHEMNEFLKQLASTINQRDVQARVHKVAVSILISYAAVHGVLWHVVYICYYKHNYFHIWRVDCGIICRKRIVTYLFVTVRIQFHHNHYSHLCTYNNASKSIWIACIVLMMLLVSTPSIFIY